MEQTNKIAIKAELDPLNETIGLLFLMVNKDKYKEVLIRELNEIGFNGELFFEKHAKYIEHYVAEFEKHYIPVEDVNQFITVKNAELDIYFRILYLSLIMEQHWIARFEEISEEVILERVVKLLANRWNGDSADINLYRLRTTEKFIAFLDECNFDDREKWLLLQLYCQPQVIFSKFVNLVKTNIPVYEKAVQVVATERDRLIEHYLDSVQAKKLSAYKNTVEGINEDITVYPCLVFPESLALMNNKLFYGLLLDFVPLNDDSPEETREFLQMRIKALSDTSKLQIMQLLKNGEKYNLEIAEHLGITPATASHHMNVLMATGLVGINKQQGKVYYHLEPEVIKIFVNKLEHYLL